MLSEGQTNTVDSLLQTVGTLSEEMRNKAHGLLDLINNGLTRYQNEIKKAA